MNFLLLLRREEFWFSQLCTLQPYGLNKRSEFNAKNRIKYNWHISPFEWHFLLLFNYFLPVIFNKRIYCSVIVDAPRGSFREVCYSSIAFSTHRPLVCTYYFLFKVRPLGLCYVNPPTLIIYSLPFHFTIMYVLLFVRFTKPYFHLECI